MHVPSADRMEIRPLAPDDAEEMLALVLRNRSHLEPWEPVRGEACFTLEGQREALARAVERREADRSTASPSWPEGRSSAESR